MNKIPMLEKFAAQSLIEHGGELIFSKEKFAELIVRACAELNFRELGLSGSSSFDVSRMIKQHFGVKEWTDQYFHNVKMI